MAARRESKTYVGLASCMETHAWKATWRYEKVEHGVDGRTRVRRDEVITPPTCPTCGAKAIRLREVKQPRVRP